MPDPQPPPRPPNLLFIYTDEQSIDTLAAYGNTAIDMPHLNRLATSAAIFEQAYVTQTVCTPSRSSLLTGLYPHTNGCTENNIPLSATITCLPEMIAGGQYATAYYGKRHLGDEVFAQHGFADWRSIEDGYTKYYRPHRHPRRLEIQRERARRARTLPADRGSGRAAQSGGRPAPPRPGRRSVRPPARLAAAHPGRGWPGPLRIAGHLVGVVRDHQQFATFLADAVDAEVPLPIEGIVPWPAGPIRGNARF